MFRYLLIATSFIFLSMIVFWGYQRWQLNQEIDAAFQESQKHIQSLRRAADAYEKAHQAALAKEKQLLAADTYGGTTPEETLALFVEALKNKDAKLAAKYFLPWKQKEAEKEIRDWIENYPDGLEKFLEAYKNGELKIYKNESNEPSSLNYVVIRIFPPDTTASYKMEFIPNPETGLWKISEF